MRRLAGVALALGLMFTGGMTMAGPAMAAPATTAVTPTLGITNAFYQTWCNIYGQFCYKTRRYNPAGGYWYWDICSNAYCTQFYNYKAHPPLSRTITR